MCTQNITEFSNEIDRRVTASIDSTLSTLRTDKISASHVKFIQNILKADDKQSECAVLCLRFASWSLILCAIPLSSAELPFLWEKLDDSVVALERLSAAVNKPEELERLIREAKKLLKHADSATSKGSATSGTSRLTGL